METNDIRSLPELFEHIGKMKFFSILKPDKKSEGSYEAKIEFTGYTDLLCTVMDIIKVSVLALDTDEPYNSTLISHPEVNVRNLLELALQLIPLEEMEVLDELHREFLKQEKHELPRKP